MATQVQSMEVIHPGSYNDGYPTFVKIDGKGFLEQIPPRKEKSIVVAIKAHDPVRVTVEFGNATTEVFEPEQFFMELGDIVVRTQPDRYPCAVLINGYDVRTKNLSVHFEEGEAVWVDVRILPYLESVRGQDKSGHRLS